MIGFFEASLRYVRTRVHTLHDALSYLSTRIRSVFTLYKINLQQTYVLKSVTNNQQIPAKILFLQP
jgi:hypothetical protein